MPLFPFGVFVGFGDGRKQQHESNAKKKRFANRFWNPVDSFDPIVYARSCIVIEQQLALNRFEAISMTKCLQILMPPIMKREY